MKLIIKMRNSLRGLKQIWGNVRIKRRIWDREYQAGKWDHCEFTMNNYVYTHVEKYCKNGSILDLGCGSGNTGNEIDAEKYCEYTGVDISSIAINKATIRSELNHRGEKNRYFQAELSSYTPQQKYDVILFRESIYYIRRSRIKEMLDRYLGYLKEEGVFIVSFFTTCNTKYRKIVDLIVSNYEIVEKNAPYGADAIVIVFRQKQKI